MEKLLLNENELEIQFFRERNSFKESLSTKHVCLFFDAANNCLLIYHIVYVIF